MENMKIFSGTMYIIPNDLERLIKVLRGREMSWGAEALDLNDRAVIAHKEGKEEEAEALRRRATKTFELANYQGEEVTRWLTLLKKFFGDFPEDDPMVQIRVEDQTEKNWADGEWPGISDPDGDLSDSPLVRKRYFADRFPTYIPASKLEGVKEGDTIEFTMTDGSNRVIRLTAKQLGSRYGFRPYSGGEEWKFEEALESRMKILKAYEAGETLYIMPLGIPYKKEN